MRKRIKPKTTVGTPIKVVIAALTIVLPLNFLRANAMAIGVPQSVAKMMAVPEKRRERKTIPWISGSPAAMS
jgi:hypothetical protein